MYRGILTCMYMHSTYQQVVCMQHDGCRITVSMYYARATLNVRICLDVLQISNNASTTVLLAECILTSRRKYCDIYCGYLWGERSLCNQITNQQIEGTAKFILRTAICTYQSETLLVLLCTRILCIISDAMVCVKITEWRNAQPQWIGEKCPKWKKRNCNWLENEFLA